MPSATYLGAVAPRIFTLSTMPSASANRGAFIYLSDVQLLYFSDGTAWTPVSTAGFATVSTSTHTLLATNDQKTLKVTAASTVTIPNDATTNLRIGYSTSLYRSTTGLVTIAAMSGVTLRNPFSQLTLRAPYSLATLTKVASNEWLISGDIGVDTVGATDTTPDAFSFVDITSATESTVYTSNTITIAGINAAAAVTISGGTYSKNGGSYTSSAGTVVNGDTVSVRVTSSSAFLTAVSATLTVGGVSDTYTVTTRSAAGPAFVWDTDLDTDCDDLLTTLQVFDAHRKGQITLVGVVVTGPFSSCAGLARLLLDAYGFNNVPVGYSKRTTGANLGDSYTTATRDRFGIVGELETSGRFTPAATLYRQLTVANPTLRIAVGGYMNGVSDFLSSAADGISSMTGSQLIVANGTRLFLVAGRRPGITDGENNSSLSPQAANNVFQNWPNEVIFYSFNYTPENEIPSCHVNTANDPAIDPFKFAWERAALPVTGDAGTITLLDGNGERMVGDSPCVFEAISDGQGTLGTYHTRSALGIMSINLSDNKVSWSFNAAGRHRFLTPVKTKAALDTELQGIFDTIVPPSTVNMYKTSQAVLGVTDNGATKADNNAVAPDGTTTADTITGSGWGGWLHTIPVYANHAYTFAVAIKKTTARTRFPAIGLQFRNGTTVLNEGGAVINTNTGVGYTPTSVAAPGFGSATSTVSVTNYPTGPNAADYWLVTVTVTSPASANTIAIYLQSAAGATGTDATRNAAGGSTAQVWWGMQFEPKSSFSGYLPTTGQAAWIPGA